MSTLTLTLPTKPAAPQHRRAAPVRFSSPSADPAMDGMIAELGRQYPQAFGRGRALATGTHRILIEQGYDKAVLGAVLKRWCRSPSYLQALARGGYRVHLDGSRADAITPEQQAGATVEVRRHRRQQKPQPGSRPARLTPVVVIKKTSRAYSINPNRSISA